MQLVKAEDHADLVERIVGKFSAKNTRVAYARALRSFLAWWPGGELNASVLREYLDELERRGVSSSATYQHLAAVRLLVEWAVRTGKLSPLAAIELKEVRGPKQRGTRAGNWLTKQEAQALLRGPDTTTLKGLRDRAILAVFLGCGLRRSEVASLMWKHLQQREGRWALVDVMGKGSKMRTVPMPSWCYQAVKEWHDEGGIFNGYIFRALNKAGQVVSASITDRALADVVGTYSNVSCHDLRRTHSKLAYKGGAQLDQIQLVLGHASIATTERYLGVELELHNAPGDHVGLRL